MNHTAYIGTTEAANRAEGQRSRGAEEPPIEQRRRGAANRAGERGSRHRARHQPPSSGGAEEPAISRGAEERGKQLSIINYQLSIINYQLSIINYTPTNNK